MGFSRVIVGNLLLADEASLTIGEHITWRVPVDLTAPDQGRIGRVGEVDVDIESGEILLNNARLEKLRANASVLLQVPALKQIGQHNCLPACARMVLQYWVNP